MTDYLTVEEVLAIHEDQIEGYGGSRAGGWLLFRAFEPAHWSDEALVNNREAHAEEFKRAWRQAFRPRLQSTPQRLRPFS